MRGTGGAWTFASVAVLGIWFGNFGTFDTAQQHTILVKIDPSSKNPMAVLRQAERHINRTTEKANVTTLPLHDASRRLSGNVFRMKVFTKNLGQTLAEYERQPGVVYAEEDGKVQAFFSPNDPSYANQWHLEKVHAEQAWDFDTTAPLYGGDPSVIVAVIDTGVAYENYVDGSTTFHKAPDYSATNFVAGYDLVNADTHADDDNGHGTHVASTIAESTNNALAGAGIAFNTTIMPVKVLDRTGIGTMSDVALGVDFAVTNSANVINLSLGSSMVSQTLHDAIQRALDAGIIVVAATGNNAQGSIAFPAAYDGVIAVSAIGRSDTLASYSNYGTGVTLCAPGGDGSEYIWQQSYSNLDSNNLPRDYATFDIVGFQGTSQATPQVSAAAALLIAKGAPRENIKAILQNSATDLGPAGYDTQYGYGRLNIQMALSNLVNDSAAPVAIALASPASPDGLNDYYVTQPTLTLSATDESGGSGIARIVYQWDSGAVTTYTVPLLPSQGTHTLTFYATDGAGNHEVAHSVTVKLDNVAPAVTVTAPKATVNGLMLTVKGQVTDATSGLSSLLLNGETVTLSQNGSFSFKKKFLVGTAHLIFTATDNAGNISTKLHSTVVTARERILSGAGAGKSPEVMIASNTGRKIANMAAFVKSFTGGIFVASGDFDGNGIDDIVVSAGPGGEPSLQVFRSDLKRVSQFLAYAKTFRGGVRVATADLDGDGKEEIITAPGPGGGPQVRVFSRSGKLEGQVMAFPKTFRGGLTIAAGDVDGDGLPEVLVGAASKGSPQVRIFNSKLKLVGQFSAYAKTFRGGVRVATADLDGDGKEEIITAPGPGGGPQVRVFTNKGRLVKQFFAYDKKLNKGVSVAGGDVDGDGKDEIITAPGEGVAAQIRVFSGSAKLIHQFYPYTKTFLGGVSIATGLTD